MFRELIREAWVSLTRNRTRSALTLAGLGWGVACFVILFAYGDGFARALEVSLAFWGDNVTIIWPGQTSKQVGGQKAGRRVRMELRDIEDIRSQVPLVKRISPEFYSTYPLESARRLTTDGVRGVNAEYAAMRGQYLEEGRLMTAEDVEASRRVAVLGAGLRRKLFSEAPAVGEEMRIRGIPFTVIGVLHRKASSSNYFSMDDNNAFIPYTAMAVLRSTRYMSVMVVQPVSLAVEARALQEVRRVLARNHRFDPSDKKALFFDAWSENYRVMHNIMLGMKIFLVLMGTLTLSIGGVGLANVMLVAVTERTHEIGVRKALGARRRHILAQFLLEALMIALVGGILGYLLSEGVARAVGVLPLMSTVLGDETRQADIHLIVSARAALTSILTLSLVALTAGFFPAYQASHLPPTESLRKGV